VTLVNAEVKNAPFSFGGTRLRAGEIGFVQTVVVTSNSPGASLIFSS
jgi:hypothetical protein